MNKEQLQQRLREVQKLIDDSILSHNEMVSEKEKRINENLANMNVLIGRKNELTELLSMMDESDYNP